MALNNTLYCKSFSIIFQFIFWKLGKVVYLKPIELFCSIPAPGEAGGGGRWVGGRGKEREGR